VIAFGVAAGPQGHGPGAARARGYRTHNIIYEVSDEIKKAWKPAGAGDPETYIGRAEVRNTSRVKGAGTVAGLLRCGRLCSSATRRLRVVRDGAIRVHVEAELAKTFQDDASEVRTGFECGAGIANFNDVRSGDILDMLPGDEAKRGGRRSPEHRTRVAQIMQTHPAEPLMPVGLPYPRACTFRTHIR